MANGYNASDSLYGDQRLNRGQRLLSRNKAVELVMQDDGNLVLYRRKDLSPLWASNTHGQGGECAIMQGDGNFVIYRGSHPLWASGTHGKVGCRLILQEDSNLVIYDASNNAVWASGTHGRCPVDENLKPGEKLLPGRSVHSANGQLDFIMQTDGNLVLYRTRDGQPIWASNTHGQPAREAIMQHDGNLVIYDHANRPLWASNTHGNHGAELKVQDDGNVCIYHHGRCLWSSNSWQKLR